MKLVRCWIPLLVCLSSALLPRVSLAEPRVPSPAGDLTLAVSYFDNTSRDESLAPLRKGIAHMLITELSYI